MRTAAAGFDRQLRLDRDADLESSRRTLIFTAAWPYVSHVLLTEPPSAAENRGIICRRTPLCRHQQNALFRDGKLRSGAAFSRIVLLSLRFFPGSVPYPVDMLP